MTVPFVAMMIPDGGNPYFSRLAQLVQRELNLLAGTGMLLLDSDSSSDTERDYIQWVGQQHRAGSISAVVYIPGGDFIENFYELFSNDLPIVVLDREIPEDFAGRPLDLVLADNNAGMRLVAEHLVAIGVSSVVYVGGSRVTEPGRVRNNAFERYWGDMSRLPMLASFNGDFSFESGRAAGEAIPRLAEFPEAVVAANDLMALGVQRVLQRCGFKIPDDIVVVGYDDIPLANWVYPSLTTVRQDLEEMARQAAGHVLRRVNGDAGRGGMRTPIEPELVIRESSAR